MKKHKILFWLILISLGACELVLAYRVPGFSDFYVRHIFPIWEETVGRFSDLFKFSLGEFLIYGGVVYVLFTLIVWMCRFVNFVDKKDSLKTLSRINSKIFFKLIILIALIQIQNCFVLYHTSVLIPEEMTVGYEANREDLIDLRERLVERANELSVKLERDSKGELVYTKDMASNAKIVMQGVGEAAKERLGTESERPLDSSFSRLKGYYCTPKAFFKSDFFSQQYMCGYYFPFSMEANYNNVMYIANWPSTMCHELSHLKGFIFEDEANFLSFIACMDSKDEFFEYSAILDALAYVNKEVKRELALEPSIREALTPMNDYVISDSVFLTEAAWKEVEEDAWFKTETIRKASDAFVETNLTVNGVSDGMISYSRVVNLLLKYYYGGIK